MKTRAKSITHTTQSKDQKAQKPNKAKSASKDDIKQTQKERKTQLKLEQNQQEHKKIIIQEEKPQKQKKATKPKKYLKKNFDQISRIARSQYQKIYLLQAQRQQDGVWNFVVQGASDSNYNVHIHYTGLKCTCTDFRIKQKPCKHIYFIVTQVAQNLEILDYFSNSLKISKNAFNILDEQLSKRLKSRMEKPEKQQKQEIDLKEDTDCTICFTYMEKETESLEGCGTCKKYFHFECLSAWKRHNPTCPLCRSRFVNASNSDDPLGKLKAIQINSQDQ